MSTKPIYVFAKWQVKQGALDTVLSLLKEVTQKSEAEKGNLFYKLHQSTTEPNTLVLYEGYVDEQAIEEHRNASHFQDIVVARIVPLLENREVVLTTALSD